MRAPHLLGCEATARRVVTHRAPDRATGRGGRLPGVWTGRHAARRDRARHRGRGRPRRRGRSGTQPSAVSPRGAGQSPLTDHPRRRPGQLGVDRRDRHRVVACHTRAASASSRAPATVSASPDSAERSASAGVAGAAWSAGGSMGNVTGRSWIAASSRVIGLWSAAVAAIGPGDAATARRQGRQQRARRCSSVGAGAGSVAPAACCRTERPVLRGNMSQGCGRTVRSGCWARPRSNREHVFCAMRSC